MADDVKYVGGQLGPARAEEERCTCGAASEVTVWQEDADGEEVPGSERGVCWPCLHGLLVGRTGGG